MAQSGIHAFSGIILSKNFKYEKWLIPSIIFGSILPDIDILFSAVVFLIGVDIENAESIHRTFTHSIFSTIIIYVIFLSISEITSDKKFITIGKGLSIGILGHIALDILFWFSEICIFWPIQPYIIEPTNIWGTDNIIYNNEIIRKILLSLEFILFRVYGWFLITKFIENPKAGYASWFIKYVSKWIKFEFLFFIICLLLIYLNINIDTYKIFFTIIYIPSLIMALISTYILRDIFNH